MRKRGFTDRGAIDLRIGFARSLPLRIEPDADGPHLAGLVLKYPKDEPHITGPPGGRAIRCGVGVTLEIETQRIGEPIMGEDARRWRHRPGLELRRQPRM